MRIGRRPLTRKYWPKGKPKLNRQAALKKCAQELDIKWSCDEYPFNATRQGCWYEECTVRDVRLWDNRNSGGELGRWMGRARLANQDAFYVKVVQ